MTTSPEPVWKAQEATRAAFEARTGRPFPTVRPPWLQFLELDGYNEELGIAFEYNGRQHYQLVPKYHLGGQADLEKQHERDARKTYLCTRHGVVLIVVPFTISIPNIPQYVAVALGHVERARAEQPTRPSKHPVAGMRNNYQPDGPTEALPTAPDALGHMVRSLGQWWRREVQPRWRRRP